MTSDTENFWAGQFGDEYHTRNRVQWESKVPFYRQILQRTQAKSALEVGCGPAWNLRALQQARPGMALAGCDVNARAIDEAERNVPEGDFRIARAAFLLPFFHANQFDLVMTSGVLIHVSPDDLAEVMSNIVTIASEYVLAIEYASQIEEEVDYRGYTGKLWRRPYGALYAEMGLKTQWMTHLGEAEGFGPGCTAWLMRI